MPGANLYTLAQSRYPLLLECRSCKHRATAEVATLPTGVNGDMTSIGSLKFRCSQCRSGDIGRAIAYGRPTPEEFVSGCDMPSAAFE